MDREKLAKKRSLPQANKDNAEREGGLLVKQLLDNRMLEILSLSKECENLKSAFEQLEELVCCGVFDEGDDLEHLTEEIETFCEIWESNSSEVYELNVDSSPNPTDRSRAVEAGSTGSPVKGQDGNSIVDTSGGQAERISHVGPQKDSLPSAQSFFKPSSALASAAALQLGVATLATSDGSFTKLTDSYDAMKERVAASKTATASSVTLSAPTLSKLLEMPPSVPGKLPSLPALYDTAYTLAQTTPSQTTVPAKRAEKRKRSQTEACSEVWQFETKSTEPKHDTTNAAVGAKSISSVQSNSCVLNTNNQMSKNCSTVHEARKESHGLKQGISHDNVDDNADSAPDTEMLSSDSNSGNSENNDEYSNENVTAPPKYEEITVNESSEKQKEESVQEVQISENMDSDTNVELENSTDAANSFILDHRDSVEIMDSKQTPVEDVAENVLQPDDSDKPMEEASNPDLTFEMNKGLANPDDSDSNFPDRGQELSTSPNSDVQTPAEKNHSKVESSRGKFTPFQFDMKKSDTEDMDNPEDSVFHSITQHSKKDSNGRCTSPTTSSCGTSETTATQPLNNVESHLLSKKTEIPSSKNSHSKKTKTPTSPTQECQISPGPNASLVDFFPLSPESNNFLSLESLSNSQKPISTSEAELSKRKQKKKNSKQLSSNTQKAKQLLVLDEQAAVSSASKSPRNSTDSAKDSPTEKHLHGSKIPGRKTKNDSSSSSANLPVTPPSQKQSDPSPVPQSDESTHSEDSATLELQRKMNITLFDEPTVVLKDYMNDAAKHKSDSDQSNSSPNKLPTTSKGSKKSESPTPLTQAGSEQKQEDTTEKKAMSRRGRRGGRTVPKNSEKSSPDSLSDLQNKESTPKKTSRSGSPEASSNKPPSQQKPVSESGKDPDSASDNEKAQAKSTPKQGPRGGRRGRRGRGRIPQKSKNDKAETPEQKKIKKDEKELEEDTAKLDLKELAKGTKQENGKGSSDRESSPKIVKEESFESEPETDKKHDDDDSNLSLPASASPMTSDDSFRVKDGKDVYNKQSSPHSSGPASQRSVVTPTTSDRESSDEFSEDSDESVQTANSNENSGKAVPRVKRARKDNEYKRWKKSICMIWREASYHKYANVFTQKVTDDVAPGYQSIVNRPMDLTLIKKKIDSGAIMTTEEFQRDMMLMFQNAIMYNSSDHDVYQMAVEMQRDVNKLILDYLATQLVIQDKIKEPVVPPALRAGRQAKPQPKPQQR